MIKLPLQYRNGHLFIELGDGLWLLDTGAPDSFGTAVSLSLAGEQFAIQSNYLGLTAEALSRFVNVRCMGILGGDVLGGFDHILDVAGGTISIATDELALTGASVDLDDFMGIPIVEARISGSSCRMFFDTGAQLSYLQEDALAGFPSAGPAIDFYPGVGQFQTETHEVQLRIGTEMFTLRCGRLPDMLGMTLMMANTQGIVGNEVLRDRTVGYFPRRGTLTISCLKATTGSPTPWLGD